MVLHLLSIPPTPDTKDQAAVRELVQGGHFLGQDDGVALDHQADAAANLDRLGGGCRGGERDEEVMDVPILLGQVPAEGVRGAPTGRDMGVLGVPDGLEAPLLAGASELIRAHGVVRSKNRDAKFHNSLLIDVVKGKDRRVPCRGRGTTRPPQGPTSISAASPSLRKPRSLKPADG